MAKKIYGIDLSKEITPIMVRDAITICFEKAHKEVLNEMDNFAQWTSEKEREKFRKIEIGLIIRNAFKKANANFENPSKMDLIKVIDSLAVFASQFRKPEIIEKHYNEIKMLLQRCS